MQKNLDDKKMIKEDRFSRIREALEMRPAPGPWDEIHDALAAENERLRNALEQIEQQLDYGQVDMALRIAREALEGGSQA